MWFFWAIVLKCFLAAVCVSVLDIKKKETKFFWIGLAVGFCMAIIFKILCVITIPIFIILVVLVSRYINSIKNENFRKLIDSINVVLHKKESFIKKIDGIVEQVCNFFKSE